LLLVPETEGGIAQICESRAPRINMLIRSWVRSNDEALHFGIGARLDWRRGWKMVRLVSDAGF
jgi:hypothetical protein